VWICALFPVGCGKPLDLGSDVIWSTSFEEAGLSSLSAPPGTGDFYTSDAGDSVVSVTTEQAHSGRYSVKITSTADLPHPGNEPAGGGGLYKVGEFPSEAYYSAWYYLPRPESVDGAAPDFYVTTTLWSILKFQGVLDLDAGVKGGLSQILDLSLASQADHTLTLVLFDANHRYLTSPLPTVVPIVPIGRWFQIEAFYRNAIDLSGHFTVWFDGTQIYDVARPTNTSIDDGGPNPVVYFTPCSLIYQLEQTRSDSGIPKAELYIDDVAISWSRVAPQGVLRVPQ
jgi:hypothetical protein